MLEKLKKSYGSILGRLGDPLEDGTLYGPLHSKVKIRICSCLYQNDFSVLQAGVAAYQTTLSDAVAAGGKVEFGGGLVEREGNYVEPAIVTGLPHDSEVRCLENSLISVSATS